VTLNIDGYPLAIDQIKISLIDFLAMAFSVNRKMLEGRGPTLENWVYNPDNAVLVKNKVKGGPRTCKYSHRFIDDFLWA
jgi:hypothetical protein